jgi:hypothetical protein
VVVILYDLPTSCIVAANCVDCAYTSHIEDHLLR